MHPPGDSISGPPPAAKRVGSFKGLEHKAMTAVKNVIAYIDGFNLYYGLRAKGWKWAYWLNMQALMRLFLKPGQKLVDTIDVQKNIWNL